MKHHFVEHIPEKLDEGVLYVSIEYDTAVHLCACGCGCEVVTPLSPAEWALKYDGRSVSLSPSIGNWNYPCQSHYWIKGGRIEWAAKWTDDRIEAVRQKDAQAKHREYGEGKGSPEMVSNSAPRIPEQDTRSAGFFIRVLSKLRW